MSFELSSKSLSKLQGVHPDLVAVAKQAIQITKIDFGISEGLRSFARQTELVKEKKSTTLHSKHLLQDSGYGHAIDVFAYVNGKVQWQNKYYGPIVQAFMQAANELDVQIESGHLWVNFQDSCHFQLHADFY